MSCGKEHHTGNCVCDVLREIVRAQKDVVDLSGCDSSCDKSISDLLGDTEVRSGLDTVPVILYCDDGCQPFKGYGAHPDNIGNVISSFYFRVKNVMDDCCAVVELLRDPHCETTNPKDPTDQKTKYLRATGICITVDLNCFCHVTCLPAISVFN